MFSPLQTDATLLANNSQQHCWMLHVASVCTPCCMMLEVFASVCTPLQYGRNNPQHCRCNNVGSCCFRLHVAFLFLALVGASISHFLTVDIIFTFFFQRNSSLFLSLALALSPRQCSIDIKTFSRKESALLFFFFSLKVRVAMM